VTSTFQLSREVHEYPGQADFWRRQIAGPLPAVMLPRDFLVSAQAGPPRPQAALSGIVELDLPRAAVRELTRLTGDEPTLRLVFHAAVLALVAARAADAGRVCLLTAQPAVGRGCPLAVAVRGCGTFRELLGVTRAAYLESAANTDVPVGFLFAQHQAVTGDFALSVDDDFDAAETAPFGASLVFTVLRGARDAVRLRYAAGLFSAETARRLAGSFVRLLDAVTADVNTPLAPLAGADAAERRLLSSFNATAASFPALPLHQFLEQAAAASPDRPAVAGAGVSYSTLNRQANRLARTLSARGAGRGDVVAIRLPRSVPEVVAVYAVLKAGAAYLPIDPGAPAERLAYLLASSGATLVLDDGTGRAAYPAGVAGLDVTDLAAFAVADGDPGVPVSPDDPAYVIYTSGSTGRPKGVVVSHRAIVNRITWMQRAYPLTPDDVVLHKTPYTFDVSAWELFWWPLARAAVSVLPSGDERDPERILARVVEHGVTVLHFVPSMLRPFLRHAGAARAARSLRTVRLVFSSGEELRRTHLEAFGETLRPGPARLINLYGPTEAAVDVTHHDCAGTAAGRPVPIGRPIDNIRLSVITAAGDLAPVGTVGELCIAGVGVAQGYRNSPAQTALSFRPDPEGQGARLYRTGDLARWLPDGSLEFLGRRDRQVKVRGQRVEPAETEYALSAVPGVTDCAVVPEPDGADGHRLRAYAVTSGGTGLEEIRAALRARLPGYLLPSSVVLVDAIPSNANGKRDAAALLRTPAPQPRSAAPADETGKRLASVWQRVLGVESVGESDNFFELGGDSIKAIEVLTEARSAGLRFTFQELFARPTVKELAELARGGGRDGGQPGPEARYQPFSLLDPRDRERLPAGAADAYPLSQLQAGLLYETALPAGRGLYHDVVSYLIPEQLDAGRFTAAVREAVRRHPPLRTSFHLTGFTEPVQVVQAEPPSVLSVVSLDGLAPGEQDACLAALFDQELAAGFTPGTTGPLRVWLHQLGERGSFYSLSYSAAALDGWSVSILHRDIFRAYDRAEDTRAPDAPVDGGSRIFPEYLRLEREAAASPAARDFWSRRLDGAVATRLPRWPEGTAARDGRLVAVHDVPLPEGSSRRILEAARRLGVPVKSVLLAVHVAVSGFVAGTDDVLTGYEHSGRPELTGADESAGLFLNTLPLRVDLAGQTWGGLVRAVFEAEAALLPFRRYPYAQLTRLYDGQGAGLDVVFNFTHFHRLKDLDEEYGRRLARTAFVSQTGFPFRAEFWQDPYTAEVGLALHYSQHEFPAEQIDRIAGYYRRAVDRLGADLDEDHRARTLLGDDELAALTERFAGPSRALPAGTALDLFERQAASTPTVVAAGDGTASLDYQTLRARSERFAAFLEARGVRHGDVVGVTLSRGLDLLTAMLGIFRAGAVYLPQDLADPASRRSSALARCGCRFVVADAAGTAQLEAELAGTQTAVLCADGARLAPAAPLTARRPAPSDLAYVIFTSGSTAEPKGASISHLGMLNHLLAKVGDLGLGPADGVAQVASQCFDISVWQLLAPLLAGGRTEIVADELITDAPAFLDRITAGRVTVLEVVPSYLDVLLGELEERPRPLAGLRYVMVTGERLPPVLTGRWFAAYQVPMVNAYGPTEASDDVTHHFLTEPVHGGRVPVGRAIGNTRLYVVDDQDRLRPVGAYGQICVTGAGVGPGYVGNPEATARAFPPNSFDNCSATMYRTGDVGRWLPDGVLDCAGRADEQVKIRGHRIELSEIEGAAAAITGIRHPAVIYRAAGSGGQLVLFHAGRPGLELAAVREALRLRLPAPMLPDRLVRLAELPLTRNGKVDRAALGRLPLEPAGSGRREPPADAAEAAVLAVFAQVLEVPSEELGVLDNFFAHGGNSLAAMKAVSRLRDQVTLADLLAAPTARELARRARRPSGAALLADLSAAAGVRTTAGPAHVVVCFPAAGGRAVSFLPLAGALAETGRPVRVLAVERPGDDSAALEAVARRLAVEAAELAGGRPVTLLGHSSGAVLALLTAAALRAGGGDPRLLLVAPPDPAGAGPEAPDDAQVLDWLTRSGAPGLGELDPPLLAEITGAFRRDSGESRRVLRQAAARPHQYRPLSPVTVLVAADDPVPGSAAEAAHRWSPLSASLRVVVTDDGGHYLNATRPRILARCVLETTGRLP
jgi:amino acid adenylation domain-containing protein